MATEFETIIESINTYDPHGLKERKLSTDFTHLRIGFGCDPLKDENWALRHSARYGGMDAPKWRREQGIDYKAYVGQRIWPMICNIHQKQIDVSEWTKFRVIDFGIRHPTVCLWVAVNPNGDRHVYKEYYSTNRSIAMNSKAILSLSAGEDIAQTLIDPAARKRSTDTLKTIIQSYYENGIYCEPADNSFAGYDSVAAALTSTLAREAMRTGELDRHLEKMQPNNDMLTGLSSQPSLTFDPRFTHRCFNECANLRWQETKGDLSQKAEKEKPMDKDDDGPDCVRYAVQSTLYFKKPRYDGVKIFPFRTLTRLRRNRGEKEVLQRQERRAYI